MKVMQMESMARIYSVDGHFELVSAAALPEKDVVQIWPTPVYTNDAGYAVFLCEVRNKEKEGIKND